jgi:hypothetical protein
LLLSSRRPGWAVAKSGRGPRFRFFGTPLVRDDRIGSTLAVPEKASFLLGIYRAQSWLGVITRASQDREAAWHRGEEADDEPRIRRRRCGGASPALTSGRRAPFSAGRGPAHLTKYFAA